MPLLKTSGKRGEIAELVDKNPITQQQLKLLFRGGDLAQRTVMTLHNSFPQSGFTLVFT